MRISLLFVSLGVSVGLSHAALDHSSKFNHVTGDKVSNGHLYPGLYMKRKRDYATTVDLLKQAVASFQQDSASLPVQDPTIPPPPPVEVPPVVEDPALAYFPPPPVEDITVPPVEQPVTPPTEETPPPEAPVDGQAPLPPNADIEEDDKFDPEEDPDDVDDPPLINGVPTQREE